LRYGAPARTRFSTWHVDRKFRIQKEIVLFLCIAVDNLSIVCASHVALSFRPA